MSRRGRRGQAPARYALRVDGHLDDHWSAWFDDLTLTRESDGTTTCVGSCPTRRPSTASSPRCATSAPR